MKIDLNLLRSYLITSIKDCSLQIDECRNDDDDEQADRFYIEKLTYESVLKFIDTFKEG